MEDFFEEIIKRLSVGGIPSPRLEARFIASAVQNKDLNELPANPRFNETQKQKVTELVSLRLQHWPLDKLLGEKGFYKYDFIVNENVLSPRPDTEVLVEAAISYAQRMNAPKILDLGTGSGCIILSILGDIPSATGVAVDISAKALDVAMQNARRLHLDSRLKFVHGSWFDNDLVEKIIPPFDMIVSNPPYIPHDDIAGLDEEVREHDPLSALDGGADGMLHYRQIAAVGYNFLRPGGLILLEGGLNQEREIADIFVSVGFSLQNILADLAGINRCVILKK